MVQIVSIAINGFGRIGRLVLRLAIENNIQVKAINDLGDAYTIAHLLKYDSIHGKYPHDILPYEKMIRVKDQDIRICNEKDPKNLPWKSLGVDIVLECTGLFRKEEDAKRHIEAGAKKVILSAPGKGNIKTLVFGVNEHEYNDDDLISNASCTTNCFAPVAKVLNDNFGIESGVMSTIHAYTKDQLTHDSPHKDLRRARAAAINIIPTSTGAAQATMKVIPELEGKLFASAIRVPVADGSLVQFTANLKEETTTKAVNELMRNVSNYHLKGILEYSEEELVSTDIVGNPHSCIFDASLTQVNGKLLSVTAWYDNEWGYSNRMIDLIKFII